MSRQVIFDEKCFPYKDMVITPAMHSTSTDVLNFDTILPPPNSIPSPTSLHLNPTTLPHNPTQPQPQPLPTPDISINHTPPAHATNTPTKSLPTPHIPGLQTSNPIDSPIPHTTISYLLLRIVGPQPPCL